MAATDLYDLCREYLEACEEAVAAAPGGAIARSFVSPGLPSFDCAPQLTVHAGGPAEADTKLTAPMLNPGHRTDIMGVVNLVTMTATVIRCVDPVESVNGKIIFPSAASLDGSSQIVNADLWAIWNHVRTRYRAGTLFSAATGRKRELFFDPAVSLTPQGGTAGWEIQIRVELDGYATV